MNVWATNDYRVTDKISSSHRYKPSELTPAAYIKNRYDGQIIYVPVFTKDQYRLN